MKKTLLISFLLTLIFCACHQAKTPQEIENEKFKAIVLEAYANPINYKLDYTNTKNDCSTLISNADLTNNISDGAVLRVKFQEGSVTIDNIGTFNGSYEKRYYSNLDGTIIIRLNTSGGRFMNLDDPTSNSEHISITIKDSFPNKFNAPCMVTRTLSLDRL